MVTNKSDMMVMDEAQSGADHRPAAMDLMHTNRESGSTYDGPAVIERDIVRGGKMDGATHMPVGVVKGKANASAHRGGLVHHAVHYPPTHKGALKHEAPGGPNMGTMGQLSHTEAAPAASDEGATSSDNTVML